MSKEFIKAQYGKNQVTKAAKQEKQLAYFTISDMQDDILTDEYVNNYVNKEFQGSDYFLNFVKAVFNSGNFLSFSKYLRKPLPSAKLINNKILPQLRRVFNAENAEFRYLVEGIDEVDFSEMLKTREFEQELFRRVLFQHNSILVSSIADGKPYRFFVDIENVHSVLLKENGSIDKIAFSGTVDGIDGVLYIDDSSFIFYDKDYDFIKSFEHGLNHSPAYFISPKTIAKGGVIRESAFTYIREELEEYVFLKTLQKMTEPNGAIPVVSQLDVDIINEESGSSSSEQVAAPSFMSSQKAGINSTNPASNDNALQAGSIFKIPVIEKDDGSVDMETVKNFITFHYLPVEALEYVKGRIKDIEDSIVYTIVGGIIDGAKEGSKNEAQVSESLSVLQNTLVYFSDTFNYIRKLSDTDMLTFKYGDAVREVSIFYGSDFFLDSESSLYNNLEKATNPIERKSILVRINQNRYRGNESKRERQNLLYDLIPFISDADFDKAVASLMVDEVTYQYQLRFNYWITMFESAYGDIVAFYSGLQTEKAQKLNIINELIINLIKEK